MDRRNVEDIFRLSEAQEALLLHSLHGRGDAGFLQLRATILGPLDVDRFRRAWQLTVEAHPMLRGSVHWKGLKHPVQMIAREASLPIEVLDVGALPETERGARLEQYVLDDRASSLDLNTAPVMRVTIVREADARHELLWTCHHVLLDGWSGAIVLNEVLQRYRDLEQGHASQIPSAGSFRDYVAWSRAQNTVAAERFWRGRLSNDGPTWLAGTDVPDQLRAGSSRATTALTIATAPLERWARTQAVTVSAVVFGCWALLLQTRTGNARPIFGATLSGRSADIERLGPVVGMFANTLPLQVPIEPAVSVPGFLRRMFEHQQEAQQFEHLPLARTLGWAGLSSRPPLFDSLVVHANYPDRERNATSRPGAERDDVRVRNFRGAVTSAFPVTLVVKPERELAIELLYDSGRVTADSANRMLQEFRNLVEAVQAGGHATLADVLNSTEAGRRPSLPVTPAALTGPGPALVQARHCEPATNAVERQLMRIFDDLLDVYQIGRDDNFFELGGDSLLVPVLIDRIERDFSRTLPLGIIFEAPTVRALAAAVTAGNRNVSWKSLVAIREHGARPPLYLVHGLGGEIDHFYNLVPYLHPEQPVYALQPPPGELSAFEQIAEHYVREVQQARPAGPYLLGGFCLGGCIAFEMARQLVDAGERVPLVIIIDAVSPEILPPPWTPAPFATRVRRLASSTPAEVFDKVRRRIDEAATRVLPALARRRPPDPLRADALPRAFYDVSVRLRKALHAYHPPPLDADVLLLRSEDDGFAPDFGWGPLVRGRLTIEMTPGGHPALLKPPHVPHAARKIAAALDEAVRAS